MRVLTEALGQNQLEMGGSCPMAVTNSSLMEACSAQSNGLSHSPLYGTPFMMSPYRARRWHRLPFNPAKILGCERSILVPKTHEGSRYLARTLYTPGSLRDCHYKAAQHPR